MQDSDIEDLLKELDINGRWIFTQTLISPSDWLFYFWFLLVWKVTLYDELFGWNLIGYVNHYNCNLKFEFGCARFMILDTLDPNSRQKKVSGLQSMLSGLSHKDTFYELDQLGIRDSLSKEIYVGHFIQKVKSLSICWSQIIYQLNNLSFRMRLRALIEKSQSMLIQKMS